MVSETVFDVADDSSFLARESRGAGAVALATDDDSNQRLRRHRRRAKWVGETPGKGWAVMLWVERHSGGAGNAEVAARCRQTVVAVLQQDSLGFGDAHKEHDSKGVLQCGRRW